VVNPTGPPLVEVVNVVAIAHTAMALMDANTVEDQRKEAAKAEAEKAEAAEAEAAEAEAEKTAIDAPIQKETISAAKKDGDSRDEIIMLSVNTVN
jgi:L,D-peptidoglycan transpeptidase YkuD (ErfK/YbiS/YcfS/YnhG family)